MKAIDDIERIKREGTLHYYRHAGGPCHPDRDVVETVSVSLRTPNDPPGRCVQLVNVEWVPHFANMALAPRVVALADSTKMLALFPEILTPFLSMHDGQLSPEAFIEGLLKVGVLPDVRQQAFVSPSVTCTGCSGIFAAKDCSTVDPERNGFKCYWCSTPLTADVVLGNCQTTLPMQASKVEPNV